MAGRVVSSQADLSAASTLYASLMCLDVYLSAFDGSRARILTVFHLLQSLRNTRTYRMAKHVPQRTVSRDYDAKYEEFTLGVASSEWDKALFDLVDKSFVSNQLFAQDGREDIRSTLQLPLSSVLQRKVTAYVNDIPMSGFSFGNQKDPFHFTTHIKVKENDANISILNEKENCESRGPIVADFQHDRDQVAVRFGFIEKREGGPPIIACAKLRISYGDIRRIIVNWSHLDGDVLHKVNIYLRLNAPVECRISQKRQRGFGIYERSLSWSEAKASARTIADCPTFRMSFGTIFTRCKLMLDFCPVLDEEGPIPPPRVCPPMADPHTAAKITQTDSPALVSLVEALSSRGAMVNDHMLKDSITRDRFVDTLISRFYDCPRVTIEALERLLKTVDEKMEIRSLDHVFQKLYYKAGAVDMTHAPTREMLAVFIASAARIHGIPLEKVHVMAQGVTVRKMARRYMNSGFVSFKDDTLSIHRGMMEGQFDIPADCIDREPRTFGELLRNVRCDANLPSTFSLFLRRVLRCPACDDPNVDLEVNEAGIHGACSTCYHSFNVDKKQPLTPFLKRNEARWADIAAPIETPRLATPGTLSPSTSVSTVPEAERKEIIEAQEEKAEWLQKLLSACRQKEVRFFGEAEREWRIDRKLGEGSYGEVFGGTYNGRQMAMKVIPFRGDSGESSEKRFNAEPMIKCSQLIPEIEITRVLSDLRDGTTNSTEGFIELLDVRVLQGEYPESLMAAWIEYKKKKKGDALNDSPQTYSTSDQLYLVMALGFAGRDLESFKVKRLEEAASIVTQVAYSLIIAEEELQFEHRDLHLGNVMVAHTDQEVVSFTLGGAEYSVQTHGVRAIVIDFTMSRIRRDGDPMFYDLESDPALFTGTGDEQFNIYRKMRDQNKGDWRKFSPHTNLLWLHYIMEKLLKMKPRILSKFKDAIKKMLEFRTVAEYFGSHSFEPILSLVS
uniref:non-specific serine/threonine protein kinase n=1 Tax=Steinernema glaseri TaxID=37863 RepID=A0A1I7XZV5_9BILA